MEAGVILEPNFYIINTCFIVFSPIPIIFLGSYLFAIFLIKYVAVFSPWDLWTLDEKKSTFIFHHPQMFIYFSSECISERSINVNLCFSFF